MYTLYESVTALYQNTLSTTWITPLLASLSTSMMWDTARTLVRVTWHQLLQVAAKISLSLLTWLGKAVTVTLSPAPVTRGVGPGGKSAECRAPLVTCLSSTDCRATRSDNRA